MINLPGYEIKKELHRGEKSIVYRAIKDGNSVILKYLNNEYPTGSEVEDFRKEYEIIRKFSLNHSIKAIGVESYKNSLVLVFEDIDATSLATLLNERGVFEIDEFFTIAMSLAKAISEIHEYQIIHKDIKPHNIIYNPITKKLKLIDFGSASLLTRESPEINMKNNLEGTLAYISPEQTGRMNCNVGYRTDFYSLGATFYQMLTGSLPFDFTDPSELVHAHIALLPESPSEKRKEIPKILSDIVLKLMEKSPESRYQTGNGLMYDLEECKKRSLPDSISVSGDVIKFELGTKDFSFSFKIPEKLYGREAEIAKIYELFNQNAKGSIALVNGVSGSGKTALINEIQKPIVKAKGHFIKGKYDKFKRNIPYGALIYSFQDLIHQILMENETKISFWKKAIFDALGVNGKIVTDVIPELETLIGKQPVVMELPASESQNRFNLVFQNFIKVFCSEEHPLVLFLDDLQWADLPSIKLLQSLLTGDFSYLFIIFSYRSNEVDATHPFSIMMDELKKTGVEGVSIFIDSLKEEDINVLVAETLHLEKQGTLELAKALHSKTNGNPFFINELFTSFYKDGFVFYQDGKWDWDISKINSAKISDNVIELMVGKIHKLPKDKIDLLKLAACLGNTFPLNTLLEVRDNLHGVTISSLEFLANEGYFLVGGNVVKFAHDRVLESVYTLLSEEERTKNHYKIGKVYLDQVDKGMYALEDRIFSIVNQLNQSLPLMSESEKKGVLEINILAGDKALTSAAYDAALDIYGTAKSLLQNDSWVNQYETTFNIYSKYARLQYLNGYYEKAENYFNLILENAKTPLEKVIVFESQIPMYAVQNKLKEALDIGVKALKILGIEFPEEHNPIPEIEKAVRQIGNRKVDDLLNIPVMTDLEKSAAMRILAPLIATSYIALPSFLPLIVLKMVNLSLEYGNHPTSALGFGFYGVLLTNALGQVDAGFEFGKMSTSLVEKFKAQSLKPSVLFFFATAISHWRLHVKENIPLYREVIDTAKEVGDFQYGSYAINNSSVQLLYQNKNVMSTLQYIKDYALTIRNFRQYDAILFFEMMHQLASNLASEKDFSQTEKIKELVSLNGENFNEEESTKHWTEASVFASLAPYNTIKLILHYLFASPKDAYSHARKAESYEAGNFGMVIIPWAKFFDSLSCLALLDLPESTKEDKQKYVEQIYKNQERMKVWSENCAANYGHKYHIIEAGLASFKGERYIAQEHFDKAIILAKEHEYTLNEAIANELYSKLWTKYGNEVFAKANLIEAHYCYEKWGSKPKLKLLEDKHPFLKTYQKSISGINKDRIISSSEANTATVRYSQGTGVVNSVLDMNTVLKASQAISTEIQLDKLLERMMFILFESAGAAKGSFILINKNKETGESELFVEAEGDANQKK